jgi:siroheme synthase-like protein
VAYYPVFIELKGRRVIVIGGGRVAEGKVEGLLAAEAEVTLVAPSLTPALQAHASNGRIRHEAREYRDDDLDAKGYDLCFVATDNGAINARIAADAREAHVMVNAADDPVNCDFILPAVVRRGDVVIAASTGGTSPALARRLREELTAFLDEDYEPLATLLGDVRAELRARGLRVDAETWSRALDARLRALVAQRRLDEARRHLLERLGVAEAVGAD